MNKRHKHKHMLEKKFDAVYINQYVSIVEAKIVCKYLNKLAANMQDIYFINPQRSDNTLVSKNSNVIEVWAVGDIRKINEMYWYEISEAFLEGLFYI